MNHRDDCGQGSSVKPQISSGTVADFANPLFQAGTFPKFNVHRPKPFARYSALSAAYAAPGWLPAVRFIPCAAYAADKAWPSQAVSIQTEGCRLL